MFVQFGFEFSWAHRVSKPHVRLCIWLVLQCKPKDFFGLLAVVCSSWVPVNSGTHKRSVAFADGKTSLTCVAEANCMCARFLCLQQVVRGHCVDFWYQWETIILACFNLWRVSWTIWGQSSFACWSRLVVARSFWNNRGGRSWSTTRRWSIFFVSCLPPALIAVIAVGQSWSINATQPSWNFKRKFHQVGQCSKLIWLHTFVQSLWVQFDRYSCSNTAQQLAYFISIIAKPRSTAFPGGWGITVQRALRGTRHSPTTSGVGSSTWGRCI